VTELTHDAAEDGFHEIQLSGKQLVALFLVVTTVIVVVFLCGVKVGRGARDGQLDEPDQVAATAPAPQPTPTSGPAAAEPPVPASDTPDSLSYPKRLASDNPTPETLKKPEEPKPQPPAAAPLSAATSGAAKPAATPPAATRPVTTPAVPPPAPAPKDAAPAAAADNLPTSGHPGVWAVQVIATKDRDVASSVLKRLLGKGYPAFLVNPPRGAAQAYFKVHVGRYADRGEAEKVSTRIKKEEQFQSWITR